MDFYAMLDQIVDLLRSRQRITYRTLKRQFDLDDAALGHSFCRRLYHHIYHHSVQYAAPG
jgi:hypothetical protein